MTRFRGWLDIQVIERLRRNGLTFARDGLIVAACYVLGDYLRLFPDSLQQEDVRPLLAVLPSIIAIYLVSEYCFRIHRQLWQSCQPAGRSGTRRRRTRRDGGGRDSRSVYVRSKSVHESEEIDSAGCDLDRRSTLTPIPDFCSDVASPHPEPAASACRMVEGSHSGSGPRGRSHCA